MGQGYSPYGGSTEESISNFKALPTTKRNERAASGVAARVLQALRLSLPIPTRHAPASPASGSILVYVPTVTCFGRHSKSAKVKERQGFVRQVKHILLYVHKN